MDLQLQGKTALVAASTSGLGLAVATALAAEGANVVVTGRRGELARQLASEFPSAIGVEADVGTEDGRRSMLEATIDAFGPIDILVLNGPGPKPGAAAALTGDDLAAAFESLVSPHHALVSAVLPGMRERRWGRILAVGSSGVVAPLPNLALSNIGRAALAGYLKTLATEVALDSVTVNMLLPGRIDTARVGELDLAAAKRRGTTVEAMQQEARGTIPARRYGTPAEFGAAAAFLCSGPASYITGVALRCDGGLIRSL